MPSCIKSTLAIGVLLAQFGPVATADEPRTLRAGAAKVDVTPDKFPVIMNGNFFAKEATGARDRLYARAVVLDDGATRLAIVVVDACMLERELLDAAKATASADTGIPPERMLVSATHTHSSPSGMGCLGTPLDPQYAAFVRVKIAECIRQAAAKTVPARVAATSSNMWSHTYCRAWIRRPDRMLSDPFGVQNVRNNMHPGHQSPDVVGPVSPVDPQFSLLAVQTADGKPLALLANFSMHYFGVRTPEVSSDYAGRWCRRMEEELGPRADAAMPFTAIFSQGTSGDSMWMDYSGPKPTTTLEDYTEGLVQRALLSYAGLECRSDAKLAMAETRLTLRRRTPDEARLKWAREKLAAMGGRAPQDRPEVYAQEAIYLHEEPERELKLQAVRIGEFGIAAIPNEVFAISGLKIKAQSPLKRMMNIALANGSEGYIPPPYQHPLGGYTTWPARTAALEVGAEPKIVEAVLGLLEQVAEKPRREVVDAPSRYQAAVSESRPVAYWRLNEWEGPTARDATEHRHDAQYVGGTAFYLPGAQVGEASAAAVPESSSYFNAGNINRSPHFAGGRLEAMLPELGERYSVELWFWNGLPADARDVTGVLFARGDASDATLRGDQLAIGGTAAGDGRGCLLYTDGAATTLFGRTQLALQRWYHVVLVRDGRRVAAYLDGAAEPEFVGEASVETKPSPRLCFGSRSDGGLSFEGRLDEAAVYAHALSAEEIAKHYAAAKP